MMHPNQWPDLIIGFLIADGILYSLRSVLHFISRRNRNIQIAARVEHMRPAALDNYRATQERGARAPLG
jgi:hypothetical protein